VEAFVVVVEDADDITVSGGYYLLLYICVRRDERCSNRQCESSQSLCVSAGLISNKKLSERIFNSKINKHGTIRTGPLLLFSSLFIRRNEQRRR
jgi:hypothetical protein